MSTLSAPQKTRTNEELAEAMYPILTCNTVSPHLIDKLCKSIGDLSVRGRILLYAVHVERTSLEEFYETVLNGKKEHTLSSVYAEYNSALQQLKESYLPYIETKEEMLSRFWATYPTVKPCPFCGSHDIELQVRQGKYYGGCLFALLKCELCGCPSGTSTDIDKVYKKWQRRS